MDKIEQWQSELDKVTTKLVKRYPASERVLKQSLHVAPYKLGFGEGFVVKLDMKPISETGLIDGESNPEEVITEENVLKWAKELLVSLKEFINDSVSYEMDALEDAWCEMYTGEDNG